MLQWLRRLRVSYWMNNLLHRKTLLCNADVYKYYGLQQSVTDSIKHADLPSTTTEEIPWLDAQFISKEQIQAKENFNSFSPAIQQQLFNWSKEGYAIFEKFYTPQECDTINQEVDRLLASETAKNRLDKRIIFSIHQSEAVYQLSTKPALMSILQFILGKEVKLFQSLNFIHGSAQRAHSDTIHMTTHPLGYMIAVWIALEDIHEDSGPLFYYPGSQSLPYVLNEDYNPGGNYFLLGKNAYQKYEDAIETVIQNNQLEKKTFLAKKGDAFVWHANILHGGSPIVNPALTRKSMVLHFYAKDVVCYHEITERPAIFGGNEAHCAAVM
jgi:ectoine hydroxylase